MNKKKKKKRVTCSPYQRYANYSQTKLRKEFIHTLYHNLSDKSSVKKG